MWFFTGGCHYSGGCRRFEHVCRACPVLRSSAPADFSTVNQLGKLRVVRRSRVVVVAISRWLAERASDSSILADCPIHVIQPGVDVDTFSPVSRSMARRALGLPQDTALLGFVALDADGESRKGAGILRASLAQVLPGRDVALVTVGRKSSLLEQGVPADRLIQIGELNSDEHLRGSSNLEGHDTVSA